MSSRRPPPFWRGDEQCHVTGSVGSPLPAHPEGRRGARTRTTTNVSRRRRRTMDPLAAVFVFCFVFGVATSLLSLALGALHGGEGGHAHGGDHGELHLGGDGGGDGAHAVAQAGGEALHADLAEGQGGQVSPFNLQTI